MNLILIHLEEVEQASAVATLDSRHSRHCCEVLKVKVGAHVRVGIIGGSKGFAEVVGAEPPPVRIKLLFDYKLTHPSCITSGTGRDVSRQQDTWFQPSVNDLFVTHFPPTVWPIELVIGLPRPKVVDRLIRHLVALGVCRIIFVCTTLAERSYLSSNKLRASSVYESLLAGLEQSGRTHFPEVKLFPTWGSFQRAFEREYRGDGRKRFLIADVEARAPLKNLQIQNGPDGDAVMLAIGPENGWTDHEIEVLAGMGFESFNLGPSVYTVDVATTVTLAQLQLLMANEHGEVPEPVPPISSETRVGRNIEVHTTIVGNDGLVWGEYIR